MVAVRNQSEIEKMRESGNIVSQTLSMIKTAIKEGMTGKELDQLAEEFIISKKGKPAFKGYMRYPATLCISINDEVVHGIPNDRPFQCGDIVSVDCGAVKNEYYADSAWTFPVGNINEDTQRLIDITRDALFEGIKVSKTGNFISDIGNAIQTYVEKNGFSVVRELVGHGIGTALHEEPQVPNYGEPGKGIRLQSGMCLAIEPMVNQGRKDIYTKMDGWTISTKDGKLSAHFEHTIVVTPDGGEILTNGEFYG